MHVLRVMLIDQCLSVFPNFCLNASSYVARHCFLNMMSMWTWKRCEPSTAFSWTIIQCCHMCAVSSALFCRHKSSLLRCPFLHLSQTLECKTKFCFAIWVSHLSQSSLKNHKLSILETISNKAASKSLTKTTSQCGWSALSLPRRTCDACPCLSSSGKFAPRPKSNAQSSDAEGLGNDGNDGNEGPGDDDDDGGDDG